MEYLTVMVDSKVSLIVLLYFVKLWVFLMLKFNVSKNKYIEKLRTYMEPLRIFLFLNESFFYGEMYNNLKKKNHFIKWHFIIFIYDIGKSGSLQSKGKLENYLYSNLPVIFFMQSETS